MKNSLTAEGRAKIAAEQKARWAKQAAARGEKSLAVVGEAAPANDAEMGVQFAAQYERAVNALPEQLKFGAMMMRLRDHLSHGGKGDLSVRGKVITGNGIKGEGIKAWVEKYAPQVKLSTAYRFEDMLKGVAVDYPQLVGAKTAKALALPDLVCADPATLAPAMMKKREALFEAVAKESQKHWTEKFRSGDGRRNNPGGFRPSMIELRGWIRAKYPEREEELMALVVNGSFTSLPKDVQAHFRKDGKRYADRMTRKEREALQHEEDGRAWCEQIAPGLNLGIDQSYFHYANAEQLAALRTALSDLGSKLDEFARQGAALVPARRK